jgi:membrane protein
VSSEGLFAIIREAAAHMRRTRTFGLAAEVAFWLFLGLVPLAVVAGYLAARTTTDNWSRLAPVVGTLPTATRELVTSEVFAVSRWDGGAVGLASAAAFVWIASSGIQALFEGLEIETGGARSWGRRRALSILTCITLSVVVAAIGLLVTGLGDALVWLGKYVPALAFIGSIGAPEGHGMRAAVGLFVALAYVMGLYWAGVPSQARRRIPLIPGALIAVVLHVLLTSAYGFYLKRVTHTAFYGSSLAIIGLTLTWLYLMSVSLLSGAVVNHVLGSRKDRLAPQSTRDELP